MACYKLVIDAMSEDPGTLSTAERRNFNRVENGSITIESMPSAAGERLIASVEADMVGEDGASINLTADLNVGTWSQSFDECP